MIGVNAEEKARVRYLMNRLAPLGGFLWEEIEKKILRLYPAKLSFALKKYCEMGKETFLVADRVESIVEEITKQSSRDAELMYRSLQIEDAFSDWFTQQNVKAEAEAVRNSEETESGDTDYLSALERKILALYLDKRNGKSRIAEVMECRENEEYIVRMLHYVKRKMSRFGDEPEGLAERLEAEKQPADW